ncbi:MAG: hypothetical protein HRT94_00020 [Alphaproteobacteria bacterium]|nr:hypothetical protein [Alphaproteobacteria bacterium]
MRYSLILSLMILGACSVMPRYQNLDHYFASKRVELPTLEKLPHCHGYDCRYKQEISLSNKEWKTISKPLKRKTKSPETERKRMARSLALFEEIVGAKTGTHEDVAKTFDQTGDFQLDCADESINMSFYLKLLEDNNLLKHHTVETPQIRGFGDGGYWLHETAVIKEKETEKLFAVDAWWKDNGHDPHIIPLEHWHDGWRADEE